MLGGKFKDGKFSYITTSYPDSCHGRPLPFVPVFLRERERER